MEVLPRVDQVLDRRLAQGGFELRVHRHETQDLLGEEGEHTAEKAVVHRLAHGRHLGAGSLGFPADVAQQAPKVELGHDQGAAHQGASRLKERKGGIVGLGQQVHKGAHVAFLPAQHPLIQDRGIGPQGLGYLGHPGHVLGDGGLQALSIRML